MLSCYIGYLFIIVFLDDILRGRRGEGWVSESLLIEGY